MSTDPPSAGCYCFVFCLMATALVLDGACNVLATKTFIRSALLKTLILIILQVLLILFALLLLCYSIFRTNVAKAGFVGILFRRFRSSLIITLVYLFCTILNHGAALYARHGELLEYNWPGHLKVFFFIQRMLSVIWYYSCKRAILRLGDPRFYDEEWVRHTLVHHESPFPPRSAKPMY